MPAAHSDVTWIKTASLISFKLKMLIENQNFSKFPWYRSLFVQNKSWRLVKIYNKKCDKKKEMINLLKEPMSTNLTTDPIGSRFIQKELVTIMLDKMFNQSNGNMWMRNLFILFLSSFLFYSCRNRSNYDTYSNRVAKQRFHEDKNRQL